MAQKLSFHIIFFVILVSLFTSLLYANDFGGGSSAGGGGGGSGPSGRSSSSGGGSLSVASSTSSGDGPFFYGLKCKDNGQLTFKQNPPLKPVIVTKENRTNFTISGVWEGTTFTSEEAEIMNSGNYIVYDSINGDKMVQCPELKFSCRLVKLNVQDCVYDNGKVTTNFTLAGKSASIDDLQFLFQKKNFSQFLIYQKNAVISSELSDVKIYDFGNGLYSLEVYTTFPISMLKVTDAKCIGKYYSSSITDCVIQKKSQIQEPMVEVRLSEKVLENKPLNKSKINIFQWPFFSFKDYFLYATLHQ